MKYIYNKIHRSRIMLLAKKSVRDKTVYALIEWFEYYFNLIKWLEHHTKMKYDFKINDSIEIIELAKKSVDEMNVIALIKWFENHVNTECDYSKMDRIKIAQLAKKAVDDANADELIEWFEHHIKLEKFEQVNGKSSN